MENEESEQTASEGQQAEPPEHEVHPKNRKLKLLVRIQRQQPYDTTTVKNFNRMVTFVKDYVLSHLASIRCSFVSRVGPSFGIHDSSTLTPSAPTIASSRT